MNNNYMFQTRDIVKMSIPVFIDQLSVILVGVVDSAMVSNCGEAVVSGVSVVDMISTIVMQVFSALAIGGAVVVSQYIGHSERDNASSAAMQTILLSTFTATILMIPCVIAPRNILMVIYGNMDSQILFHGTKYFFYVSMSYPFLAIYLACASIFRSTGNTKPVMVVSCIINLLNCIGNAILIFGFDMGAAGAAISTTFARLVGAVMMIILIRKSTQVIDIKEQNPFKFNPIMLKRVINVGAPTGFENLLFQAGGLITRRYLVMMADSTIQIAANAVASSMFGLINVLGNTMMLAVMPIIGQCIGADRKDEAKKHLKDMVLSTSGMNFLLSIAIFFALRPIIHIFGVGEETTNLAWNLMAWNCLFLPIFWAMAFVVPAGLRAAGDNKFTMIASMMIMWLVRVGLGYYLCIVLGYGALGIWYAMFFDWIVRAVVYGIRYKSGKWLEKKVI